MPTILIADDSRLMQRNLTMTLQQAGYDLLLANNGYEALAVCSKQTPDLVILDCLMPEMSGQEACRIIRSNPATQHLPVLLMSVEDKELRRARGVGANATLLKPIETKELLSKVNSLLAPTPEVDQPLTLLVEPESVRTRVVRILGHQSLGLASVPGAPLTAGQSLNIEYDALGGVKIQRDATVSNLLEGGIVLTLGSKVSIEQRRRHFRKQIEVPVRYRLPGDFFRLGRTLDISGGGMRLSGMSGQPEAGMVLDFQLVIDPSVHITVQGIIRRIIPAEHGSFEVGVEFAAIDPNVQQELTMFLFAGSDAVSQPSA